MNYHNITKEDMLNGEGLRTVLWVAGCNHYCKGCQNPETWDACGGIPFDDAARQEIMESLEPDYIDGITFSGGDPLYPGNRQTVTEIAKEIKQKYPEKTIWSYTGFLYEDVKDLEIMEYIDVLVDGEFIQELNDNTLHWVGSPNQRVIDIKETRKQNSIIIYGD